MEDLHELILLQKIDTAISLLKGYFPDDFELLTHLQKIQKEYDDLLTQLQQDNISQAWLDDQFKQVNQKLWDILDYLERSTESRIETLIRGTPPFESSKFEHDNLPPERKVSTGFAYAMRPDSSLPPDRALITDHKYLFWLEIGELVAGSIDALAVDLPLDHLPEAAELEVSLSSIGEGFRLPIGSNIGVLKVTPTGTVDVMRQPSPISANTNMEERRMFFPLRTPDAHGICRLFCNIYYCSVLIQSREITAHVSDDTGMHSRALETTLIYTLTSTLDPDYLAKLPRHHLSVLLSNSQNDHYGFHLFGHQYQSNSNIGENQVQNAQEKIREALRLAAWGKTTDYNKNLQYRYATTLSKKELLNQISEDLPRLAVRGHDFYFELVRKISGGGAQRSSLQELMLLPGYVQLVLQDPKFVLPLACFYDYPLDTDIEFSSSAYSLCPDFLAALEQHHSLTTCRCFQGDCRSRGKLRVVCPSGFWGFRHYLGMPLSIKDRPFAPIEISYTEQLHAAAAFWTGSDFTLGTEHFQKLSKNQGINWHTAYDVGQTIEVLRQIHLSLVYFYCHGGQNSYGKSYLTVGRDDKEFIGPATFDTKSIKWKYSHPLVFLNGCKTTALSVDQAMDFVTAFIDDAWSSGVIGSEIAIFEPLAVAFFEAFLPRFVGGVTVGEAIRDSRLDLLKQYNPLGLVYVPFVMSGLRLVPTKN